MRHGEHNVLKWQTYHERMRVLPLNLGEADKFYIIVRGFVQVTTGTNGTERVLVVLQDGDHFGEIALLQDVPRTATIGTRTASLFVTLSRDQLLRLAETVPQLCTVLHEEIARRLARSQAKTGEELFLRI
jgi:ATP-binding cassette subfamily B protein